MVNNSPDRMPSFLDKWLQKYRDQGVSAHSDRYSYGHPEIQFRPSEVATTSIKFGAFCSVARGCVFNLGSFGRHSIDFISSYPLTMLFGVPGGIARSAHETNTAAISVGSDVWFGEGSLIFSGVTIGHGAVIGARSIVNTDVPPYSIFAGYPARLVRYRFDEQTIKRLLALQWWEWSDEDLRERLPYFLSRDVASALDNLEALVKRL